MMAVLVMLAMTVTHTAHADFMFTENFNGPGLNPNFEVTNGYAGYQISGTIGNLSHSERQYVRTVDSDYNNFDYRITVNHNFFVGSDIAFVGVGNGSPDATFTNEPGFGSMMFRLHNPALAGGRIDYAFWQSGDQFSEVNIGSVSNINEPIRISIARYLDTLTMGFDLGFTGTYTPDYVQTFDLSDAQYSDLKTALDNESRLFFGSTFGSEFDDFVVTKAVPEPATGLPLLAISATVLLRRRR